MPPRRNGRGLRRELHDLGPLLTGAALKADSIGPADPSPTGARLNRWRTSWPSSCVSPSKAYANSRTDSARRLWTS